MMRRFCCIIIVFVLLSEILYGQLKTNKPVKTKPQSTKLTLGVGGVKSVLFLSRNVKENNDAKGLSFQMTYGINRLLRTSAEFTYYRPINIEPTWYDISANTLEANLHIITHFRESKSIFYPIFGLSYNHFSGFFTGKNDFMGLYEKYNANSVITTNWLGLNVGTGYEAYIKSFSLFIDYKMRVGYNNGKEIQLNIMDVCIGAGLRYNFKVPTLYKLIKGTKSRYMLDKEKSDE